MAIKSILVSLDGDESDSAILSFAGSMAKRLAAHLTALYIDPDPRETFAMLVGDGSFYVTQDVIEAMQARNAERRAAAEKAFGSWQAGAQLPLATSAASDGGSTHMVVEVGEAQDWLRAYALVTDLAVAPLPDKADADRLVDLSSLLFDSRQPVLIVPKGYAQRADDAPALIAWNGSPEASRALHAAVPLLKHSRRVIVAYPEGGNRDGTADRVLSFLGWHGIKAEGQPIDAKASPEAALESKVRELECGLLVMGAYGHSRIREFVLGGVTRYMLESAPVPLFMVH